MTGFFTKADYTQSPDSENNPLIMTLPDFSVFSAPALSEQLLRLVVVPAKDAPKRDKAKFLKEPLHFVQNARLSDSAGIQKQKPEQRYGQAIHAQGRNNA